MILEELSQSLDLGHWRSAGPARGTRHRTRRSTRHRAGPRCSILNLPKP